jgi:hypothetical protein
MFLIHSKTLPTVDVWFRHTFGCEPSGVSFFTSPVKGGWDGASLQGVLFHVLTSSEYDRKKFEHLYHDRPLRVFHASRALAQKPEVATFVAEQFMPALADTVGGVLYQHEAARIVYTGDVSNDRPRQLHLIDALRVALVHDGKDDDWSDL